MKIWYHIMYMLFSYFYLICNLSLREVFFIFFFQIFSHLTDNIIKKIKASPPDAEALRMFLILPLYHEMRNPRRHPELQVN